MDDGLTTPKNNPVTSELYKFNPVEFIEGIFGSNLMDYQKEILVKVLDNLSKGKKIYITPPARGGIPQYIIFDK